jgi:hypothetical protein
MRVFTQHAVIPMMISEAEVTSSSAALMDFMMDGLF